MGPDAVLREGDRKALLNGDEEGQPEGRRGRDGRGGSSYADRRPASIYIAKATGIATGFQLTREGKSYVVLFKEAKLDESGVDEAAFAFKAPDGATMAEAVEMAPGWASVSPIFAKSCMPCHGEQKADGIDLRTYNAAMGSMTIVPGNAAGSTLVKSLRGTTKPRMPQGRPPLPEATIQKVEKWIKAGAKA